MEREHADPYLVIGTGRCGTSTVARILHEKLGVCMGHSFIPPDKNGPDGYYEDEKFVSLNGRVYRGELDMQDWLIFVKQEIYIRQAFQKPWGIKNIRMVDLLGMYLSFFNNPKIICCHRKKEDVVASFIKCYSSFQKQAEEIYSIRTTIMERLLRGRDCLSLDFTSRLDEEYIKNCIIQKWNPEEKVSTEKHKKLLGNTGNWFIPT